MCGQVIGVVGGLLSCNGLFDGVVRASKVKVRVSHKSLQREIVDGLLYCHLKAMRLKKSCGAKAPQAICTWLLLAAVVIVVILAAIIVAIIIAIIIVSIVIRVIVTRILVT